WTCGCGWARGAVRRWPCPCCAPPLPCWTRWRPSTMQEFRTPMKRAATKPEHGTPWDPLLAVEFLTIARVRPFRLASVEAMARAQAFYPLVGLCLGGLLVLVDLALSDVLPSGPLAAVLVAVLAIATRGL